METDAKEKKARGSRMVIKFEGFSSYFSMGDDIEDPNSR